MAVSAVSNILKALKVNNGDNGHHNHTDGMRKLQVDMDFLSPPKYSVNLSLAEILNKMSNTISFVY